MFARKSEIEANFGSELEWEKSDNKRACIIRKSFNLGGYKDEDKWQEVIEKTVESMVRLESAIKPYIQNIF